MAGNFTSIAHPIGVDAGLGRLAEERDYPQHVAEMVRQVLLTNPGERINRPDFGCGIRRMLFDPNSEAAANLLQASVMQALDTWLGSVIKTQSVTATATGETLTVSVAYVLLAVGDRQYLNVEVSI
jgi:uncharacterized protein